MPNTNFMSKSEAETAQFACDVARSAQKGDIFTLNGNLGAGKTVFCRSFIKALCGDNTEVPSPTFTLVQTYQIHNCEIWHFDLYRLEEPEEIYEIGWEEALENHIMLIEWPTRLGTLLPAKHKTIDINILEGETREITIKEN